MKKKQNNRLEGIHIKGFISGYRNSYFTELSEKRIILSFSQIHKGVQLSVTIHPNRDMSIIRDQSKTKLIWTEYIVDLYTNLNILVDKKILSELYPNSYLTSRINIIKNGIRNNLIIF